MSNLSKIFARFELSEMKRQNFWSGINHKVAECLIANFYILAIRRIRKLSKTRLMDDIFSDPNVDIMYRHATYTGVVKVCTTIAYKTCYDLLTPDSFLNILTVFTNARSRFHILSTRDQ